jgi:hypothetical protein
LRGWKILWFKPSFENAKIFQLMDRLIRIPLSGILIKFISLPAIAYAKAKQAGLRPLRLCG